MFRILGVIYLLLTVVAATRNAVSILPVEYEIVDSPVECFVGFSSSGVQMFSLCGDARGVTPTPEQIDSLRGGFFTHSHVGECPTFSFGDVDSGARSGVTQVRVVSHLNGKVAVAVLSPPRLIPLHEYQEVFDTTSGPICTRMDQTWRVLARRFDFRYDVTS